METPVPCDPARLFSCLYCGAIALQTLIHQRELLRFFRTRPARIYGPPPLLLGSIPLPFENESLFIAAGSGFTLALAIAAAGMNPPAALSVALLCYPFYFRPVLPHGHIQRKTNLIPMVLIALIAAPAHAIPLVKLCLALVYLSAGFEKLREAGLRWASGQTLQAYLLEHYLYTDRAPALWLAERPRLCRLLSTAVLGWELSFWLILFLPSLTWLYVPIGLGFHAGTSIGMRIHYWVYFCPAYLVFFAPSLCRLFGHI
jgi:hypothetical protein